MKTTDYEKQIDAIKERMLVGFLKDLEQLAFVKETNSVTGEQKELNPIVEDMEATIRIDAEFDREDLKNLLMSRAG